MARITSLEDLQKIKNEVEPRILARQDKDITRIKTVPVIQIRLCRGSSCVSSGAMEITKALEAAVKSHGLEHKVKLIVTGCHGLCEMGPIIIINPGDTLYTRVKPEDIEEIVNKHLLNGKIIDRLIYHDPATGKGIPSYSEISFYKQQERRVLHNNGLIDPWDIGEYIARDGYQALAKTLYAMKQDEVLDEMKKSQLRGRGGAGFPTATKWGFLRSAQDDTKYIVCNGDEGDPGAYMNRSVLEGNPHAVIEGMIIGAYAMGNVHHGYAYIRAEYPLAIETLTNAIKQAREYGLLGNNIIGTEFSFDLDIFPGAGAFVCGEETALLISIEGKRGNPRQRPPFPANKGLFGKPTVINNVETWANVPMIIHNGADWFTSIGSEQSKGTKTFSLTGKINNTGLVEVPLGSSLRQIVFDIGGGIPGDKKFKAVQIGGPSGGVIPVHHLNTPVDYESVTALGAIMGSGGLVVMDEDSCMVDVAKFFLQFSRDESCGKCTPCRVGIPKMLDLLTKISDGKGTLADLDTLQDLAEMISSSSICGLGQTAPNPVLTTIRHFLKEYESHILDNKCPAVVCQALFSAPCQHTCPVGINVPKYVAHIASGEFKDAIETIRDRNPFASVCGYICHHPCERKCRRRDIDESIAIRTLKRFAADWYTKHAAKLPSQKPFPKTRTQKVAVVGGGPAGLSCAYYLAQMGYPVTVFEALPVGGGMLSVAIPQFRLPAEAIQQDIDFIEQCGVEIKYNTPINSNFRVRHLLNSGFNAVFIAFGSQKSQKIGMPGELEDIEGLHYGLRFLRDVKTGRKIKVGDRVVVIGGGNVALDAARTALRLGAKKVDIFYRRSREEMPVTDVEYDEAVAEGVNINFLVSPIRIDNEQWRATGIYCNRMQLGEMDSEGRRRSIPMQGSEFFVPADTVIVAVGQSPDLSFLPPDSRLERTRWETLVINENNLSTSVPGIFSGGDFVTGPDMVINAIASGKRGAIAIDKYFEGDSSRVTMNHVDNNTKTKATGEVDDERWQPKARLKVKMRQLTSLNGSFEEIEMPLTDDEAIQEAKRCLRCDLEAGE